MAVPATVLADAFPSPMPEKQHDKVYHAALHTEVPGDQSFGTFGATSMAFTRYPDADGKVSRLWRRASAPWKEKLLDDH